MWGQSQDGDSWEPQGPSVGPGQRGTRPLTAHRTEEGEAFMISNGRGSGQRSLMRTAAEHPPLIKRRCFLLCPGALQLPAPNHVKL